MANNIIGDDNPNNIPGTSGDDIIDAKGGNDTIDAGAGNDTIIGGSGADVMTGGPGADIFRDTAANFNGDRITDFLIGDRIQITDLTVANANIHIQGSSLAYTGGSIQIDNLGPGRLVLRNITSGGVEIRLQLDAHNDFNGDGRSDILLRDDSGLVYNLLGTANGGFVNNGGNSAISASSSTQIVASGDFNGDGRVDTLWRTTSGSIYDLLSTANGGVTNNGDNSFVNVPTTTKIVGVGDFNGDGRTDILLRDANGTIFDFLGTANGGFTNNGGNSAVTIAGTTNILGIGDFNGDGKDDVLFRDATGAIFNFLGTDNGGFANNGDTSYVMIASGTNAAGIGDFNGDGRADVLWRDSTGTIFNFLSTTNGGYTNNGDNSAVHVDSGYTVASVGDFNGDAIDDILWRGPSGQIFDFLGNSNGGFVNNGDNSYVALSTATHIQDPFH